MRTMPTVQRLRPRRRTRRGGPISSTSSDTEEGTLPRRALLLLATLGAVAALYLGHVFIVPVCLALVLIALLYPVVAWLARRRVPAPAGATLAVLASLALMAGGVAALEPPVRGLAHDIPRSFAVARARLARFEEPLARIGIRLESQPSRTGTRFSDAQAARSDTAPGARTAGIPADSGARTRATKHDTGSRTAAPSAPASGAALRGPPSEAPSVPASGVLSAIGRTFGVTAELLGELVEVLLLALFVLAGGPRWGQKLARAIPDDGSRHTMLEAVTEMRGAVARYVVATALINLGQGIAVALVMWALGMPSPLLWGVLTFVLEFVPYLGGFVMIALLLVVGLASSDSLLHALLAPLSYLAITSLQNNLVSPIAYGRGLRLNPAAILLAVMFWYAMWGVSGAFLAVPILAALHILTTRVRALAPVAAFLED